MKRRTFIRNMISTTVLTIGGVTAFQYYQQSQLKSAKASSFDYQFLSEHDRILLGVLVPVFVSVNSFDKPVPLNPVLKNIDAAVIRLSLTTQKELRELFDLLGSGLGRLMLANVWLNWQAASSESVDLFLTDWRESSLELLQIAYKGLQKLIIGSVYSEENAWSNLGYSGPPSIDTSWV